MKRQRKVYRLTMAKHTVLGQDRRCRGWEAGPALHPSTSPPTPREPVSASCLCGPATAVHQQSTSPCLCLIPQHNTLEVHPIVRGSGEKATRVDGSLPVCLLPSLPTRIHGLLAPRATSPPPTMTSNSSWVSNGASLETVSGKKSRMFPLCHIIYAPRLKIG